MSKRFGRNQRRRAREALAVEVQRTEQTARLASDRLQMYQNCSRELDNLREFFGHVARRVGRESILVGGEVDAELDGPDVHSFRVIVRDEMPSYRVGAVAMPAMAKMQAKMQAQMMHRLEVKAVRDSFAQQIGVRCYLGNAQAGIAMSDQFLARSTEQELAHRIAQELAQCLARDIKRAK